MSSTRGVQSYDYIVIGGGSGGSGGARLASSYGAKTLLVENGPSGGTCINYGCRPKILTWNFASFADMLRDSREYGFATPDNISFDYRAFKLKRDAYVKSQSDLFEHNWKIANVEFVSGTVTFRGQKELDLDLADGRGIITVTAPHICLAAGGNPVAPENVPGARHGITHIEFFALEELPKTIAIVGAGYIATEIAGMLNAVGVDVHLYIRGKTLLRAFDPIIQETITKRYEDSGIHIHKGYSQVENVEKLEEGPGRRKRLRLTIDGKQVEVDELLWAIGRNGRAAGLNIDGIGIQTDTAGHIVTDEYQNTSVPGIYAVGDVTGRKELQPVALEAGRQLAKRIFGGNEWKTARVDYNSIPTVVFAHPEVGAIGLTEPEARRRFGTDRIKTYHSVVVNTRYAIFPPEKRAINPTEFKLVCEGPDEKVVGLHMLGLGVSEMLQGFAVAVNMGATRMDFNKCLAIHPTSAEALVVMK